MNQERERVIAAHRRAGQELAREQPNITTAGVIYAGVIADMMAQWDAGTVVTTNAPEATLEVLLGDVLGSRAAGELPAMQALHISRWMANNHALVEERAQGLLAAQRLILSPWQLPQEQRCHAVAAMERVSVADDSTTADVAFAAAVAVARLRHDPVGDGWDDALTETVFGDPVWVAAAEEISDAKRAGVLRKVCENWELVTQRAVSMATVDTVISMVTVEDIAAQAREKMTAWLGRTALGPAAVAYGAAAAEGLMRWQHRRGIPIGEDAFMRGWAASDPAAVGMAGALTDETRETVRLAVRAVLPDLMAPA